MATDLPDRQRVERVASALRALFSARPAGLLTDVDGTISRITAHANAATVAETVRQSLTALAAQLDLVSVVTGRAVLKAQEMVGLPEIGYVGNHGLEWLEDGAVQTDPAALAVRPALEAALTAVRAATSDPGLVYEDKHVSASIHYRLAADPDAAGRRLHDVLAPHLEDGQLRLIQGGFVVNLLPGLRIDKGEATRRLVRQHGLRSVAFFGDDVTDVDAFRAIRELEAAGQVRGLAVGVLSPEAPPAVREQADLLLDGVGEVEAVLAALASEPPMRAGSGA
ncbi:MAG: trehalose-phosphatase [Chloroflexi bacterium]|nr:trehalose-phosphatase [Chloroflexota bacterium]